MWKQQPKPICAPQCEKAATFDHHDLTLLSESAVPFLFCKTVPELFHIVIINANPNQIRGVKTALKDAGTAFLCIHLQKKH